MNKWQSLKFHKYINNPNNTGKCSEVVSFTKTQNWNPMVLYLFKTQISTVTPFPILYASNVNIPLFCIYLNNFYTQHGARTPNPKIQESHALPTGPAKVPQIFSFSANYFKSDFKGWKFRKKYQYRKKNLKIWKPINN